MKWFIGILFIALGVFAVLKTEWILSFFGRNSWAEAKLGAEGGSRLFYKLIGIALIIFAFLLMTGIFTPFLDKIFNRGLM